MAEALVDNTAISPLADAVEDPTKEVHAIKEGASGMTDQVYLHVEHMNASHGWCFAHGIHNRVESGRQVLTAAAQCELVRINLRASYGRSNIPQERCHGPKGAGTVGLEKQGVLK